MPVTIYLPNGVKVVAPTGEKVKFDRLYGGEVPGPTEPALLIFDGHDKEVGRFRAKDALGYTIDE